MNQEKVRLQKYMSQAWICSRRKAEIYIADWLVKINGVTAKIGQSIVVWVDKITLEDKLVKEQKNMVYYKMNKPRWIVTTCAQAEEQNIVDLLNVEQRIFPIWRLDKETTWLILLTNDWRLWNYLIHPRYNHEKEYMVETYDFIEEFDLKKMEEWIFMLWWKTKRSKIKRLNDKKFLITLTEWKNRQIRRMVEKIWHRVKKLKRVRIENILLWNLEVWEYKTLTKFEKDELFKKIWIE